MPSPRLDPRRLDPRRLDLRAAAAAGGVVYAVTVLAWMLSNGVSFDGGDPISTAFAVGYSVVGLWLMAAVPLYLLGRASLVSPLFATGWLLGNTAYQWAYGTHLHPLSSHLTVWPLLFAVVLAAGAGEALIRLGTDRVVGVGGLRRFWGAG
ncbi:hypothetical protein FK85_30885 [Halorubrum saccharovorum]|uniref:Uncharacterized protein n=1 Tax=Halorubrum saccharovorum TaxID=2248 RepID=A0A0F8AX87_9EURY|nr:hypothetical protein [Halorubrum saccharovorum]KKF39150.1 hypothetical protein FK85_30885 [Halorubrum saccharovorum]